VCSGIKVKRCDSGALKMLTLNGRDGDSGIIKIEQIFIPRKLLVTLPYYLIYLYRVTVVS